MACILLLTVNFQYQILIFSLLSPLVINVFLWLDPRSSSPTKSPKPPNSISHLSQLFYFTLPFNIVLLQLCVCVYIYIYIYTYIYIYAFEAYWLRKFYLIIDGKIVSLLHTSGSDTCQWHLPVSDYALPSLKCWCVINVQIFVGWTLHFEAAMICAKGKTGKSRSRRGESWHKST